MRNRRAAANTHVDNACVVSRCICQGRLDLSLCSIAPFIQRLDRANLHFRRFAHHSNPVGGRTDQASRMGAMPVIVFNVAGIIERIEAGKQTSGKFATVAGNAGIDDINHHSLAASTQGIRQRIIDPCMLPGVPGSGFYRHTPVDRDIRPSVDGQQIQSGKSCNSAFVYSMFHDLFLSVIVMATQPSATSGSVVLRPWIAPGLPVWTQQHPVEIHCLRGFPPDHDDRTYTDATQLRRCHSDSINIEALA